MYIAIAIAIAIPIAIAIAIAVAIAIAIAVAVAIPLSQVPVRYIRTDVTSIQYCTVQFENHATNYSFIDIESFKNAVSLPSSNLIRGHSQLSETLPSSSRLFFSAEICGI